MRKLLLALFAMVLICACDNDDNGDDGEDTSSETNDGGGETDEIDTETETETEDEQDLETDTEVLAWAEKIDEYWGEAPEEEKRLAVFDELWDTFAKHYACFDAYNVDWDEQKDYYRPRVKSAQSHGRFYQLLREMLDKLHDSHSPILSTKVCQKVSSVLLRPPVFRQINVLPLVGGCVTLDDDGELMVYQAAPSGNPLEIEPGDVIVGFDDKPWTKNLEDIKRWKLPECDEDFAGAPISAERQRAAALPSNAHLFESIQIKKYATGEVETYSTDLLMERSLNYTICSDQIPVEGVDFPVENWAYMDPSYAQCVSHGIVPNTNIGYITSYAWLGSNLQDFQVAVEELAGTDGLIIDQRFNLGGVVPFVDYGFPYLFNEDIDPLIRFHGRDPSSDDYFALVESYTKTLDADEDTYYDHPIAVLTGPKAGSAGDLAPYMLSHHPRSKSFGRATNGAFGELQMVWGIDPHVQDFSLKVTRNQMVSADGDHLQAWEQIPDEQVWFTKDDAAAGIDTVFEAALSWINQENRQN